MIVVEVDDDEAAERLVQKFSAIRSARVKGFFQVPKSRCSCPGPWASVSRSPDWKRSVRGKLFGWWVHDKCHKPSRGLHNLKNLMAKEDQGQGPQSATDTYLDYLAFHDKGYYDSDPD